MDRVKVMVNGLPGNMASNVAKHALNDDRFELIPQSLTGPEITATETTVESTAFALIHPHDRDQHIAAVKETSGAFISVDYSLPPAVNDNAQFYCRQHLPFVMGTTGGDRDLLVDTVTGSSICAVIAPNMAKQIVGFQAMMEDAARTFPNLFEGYTLEIKESHQQGKADTSGTAKAMVQYFNSLGTPFSADDIVMERDPDTQKDVWGIPENFLTGHGWHTYTLTSKDKTVRFEFTHNVNGRDVYALGTLDAIIFLYEKVNAGVTGKAFSMIDVLKGA
jgi:4-hydroxy-tetrahydrodipicolinate reductase